MARSEPWVVAHRNRPLATDASQRVLLEAATALHSGKPVTSHKFKLNKDA